VSRTTIDLDDDKLAAAARELGTSSKIDTVNAALASWPSGASGRGRLLTR